MQNNWTFLSFGITTVYEKQGTFIKNKNYIYRLRRSLEDGAERLQFSGRGYAATDNSYG